MKRIQLFPLIVILIIVFILYYILHPLVTEGFPSTDDGTWMIIRLSAFYQSLREGQFPVRFLGRLNHNYGYPVSNFLYPGFLYMGSFLKLIGFSFVDSVKLLLSGSIIGSSLFIFLWLRKRFSFVSSGAGVLSFITSPYILYDLYVRGSVGELVGIFCASLTLFLLEKEWYELAAISIGLLIISHNTIAMLFLLCLVITIVVLRQWRAFISIISGMGIAAFFWIPAILEQQYVLLQSLAISDPQVYFLQGGLFVLLPLVFLGFTILLFIGLNKKERSKRSVIYSLIILGCFFMTTSLSFMLWKWSPLAKSVQFPYRFLAIVSIFGPWIVSFISDLMDKNIKIVIIGSIVLIGMIQIYPIMNQIRMEIYPEGYYATNEATTTVKNEYMPVWAHTVPLDRTVSRLQTISGSADIIPEFISTQKIESELKVYEESIIQINTVYYPGWGITLNSVRQKIYYDNPFGFMQIYVEPGTYKLFAQFRETPWRFIADLISLSSIVFVSFYYVRRRIFV